MPILPCLVAFCQAFPPLYDDVAALLVQVGQVCASDVATKARDIDPLIAREYSYYYNLQNDIVFIVCVTTSVETLRVCSLYH